MTNLTPGQFASIRASGRAWLVGPAVLAGVVRNTASLRFDARRLESSLDKAGVRRLFSTHERPVAGDQYSDEEIEDWLKRSLAKGRLMAMEISLEESPLDLSLVRAQQSLPLISGGAPSSVSVTFPGRQPGLGSMRQRCVEVVLRAAEEMELDLKRQFYDLLVASALADAASALARWTERYAITQSAPFDGATFSLAYALSGWSAFDGLKELAECVRHCWAYDDNQTGLDDAAERLACAISHLGASAFVQLTSGIDDWGYQSVEDVDAIMERWAAYIGTLTIRPIDAGRGAVWGALGVRKHALAAATAQRRGEVTMASALSETGFEARYLAEFGAQAPTRLGRRVWDAVCVRYLSQLRGTVTYYSDEPAPTAADASSRNGLARLLAQLGPTVLEVNVIGLDGLSEPFVLQAPFTRS